MGFLGKFFGKSEEKKDNRIYAPVAGCAVSLKEVRDPTFSSCMLGNGVAIIPEDGKVCAPCDATVDMMFTTGHAVSLVADNGAEILIHVGLETVSMNGKGFTVHVQNGQRVKTGQLMIEVDLEMLKTAGLNPITPVLVCNSDEYGVVGAVTGQSVSNDDVVMEVTK